MPETLEAPAPTRPTRRTRPFLAGPLDWHQLDRAAALPGRALHVWLILQNRVRITGQTRTRRVSVNQGSLARAHGLDRWALRRGLQALEAAGLVDVIRRPGRCLEVRVRARARGG